MRIPYFHVDAFTGRLFGGNPAGVCVLEQWLPDVSLQRIAAENNLSETAFFTREKNGSFRLRWFTPTVEVDLCGHATLAAAFVLFTELGYANPKVKFDTRSGCVSATRLEKSIELDFPTRAPSACAAPEKLLRGLGATPIEVLKARDYLAVFATQSGVATLKPDMSLLAQLDCLGIIVTAAGDEADFVSRFFAPGAGVPEDPVTGSSHCTLIPYWANRLGKTELFARQLSPRGGELHCRLLGERVGIAGEAVIYARGQVEVG